MAKRKLAVAADTADTTTHHAPSVRTFTEWTPARIRSAAYSAEQGNLYTAVQVCEWLLTDDRIRATLNARLDALFGLEPTFEPGTGRRASRAVKALEADEDWWDAYPESELRQLVLWGLLLGVAPARHGWTASAEHGGRVLPMPKFWHPQQLRWDWHTRRWTVRDDKNLELEVVAGDGEWILHTPGGAERPWTHGLWQSLARWCLLKHYAIQDWARVGEKGALLVATAPEKATPQQRRELAADLNASGADTVVALAAGFDLKRVEATANTKQIYEAQVNAADAAFAILIRGSNLTTEVKEGSRAAAETQAKTGDGAKLKADAQALATTLNAQSLSWWAEFNFGDRRLAPWPKWPVESEEDKSQRATMVKTLGEGLTIFDKLGFDIDPEGVQKEFGLSFLKGRSREREPDPVPTAPGAGQAGDELDDAAKPAAKSGKPPAKASASLPRMAADSGFVEGQLYTDDLVDSGVKHGAAALKPFLEGILEAVELASDYDSLRDEVIKRYGESLPPEELRGVLQKALVLAELAGYAAVRQDS